MTAATALPAEQTVWGTAAAVAVAVHAGIAAAAVLLSVPHDPPVPEPVMLVELPPAGAPAQQVSAASADQPQTLAPITPVTPQSRIEAPLVRAPVPADAVTLPPPAPVQRAAPQAVAAPTSVPAPAPAPALALASTVATARPEGVGSSAGFDAAAQKAEADYKSLVGSFIRRNRFSPPQSRKAGLSGSVKVRFIVDRRGGISAVAVAGSSGADLLDREAVQFIQALGRVPAFPTDLRKAEIPLSMTLKFDLERR